MESPAQTCARLLSTLEDLVTEEAGLLAAEQVAEMVALQARMAPLVDRLVVLAPSADSALRGRVRALMERRAYTGAELSARIAHLRGELDRMAEARHTVHRLAPVYREPPAPAQGRFSAVG
jgi:hypothetical protein